MNVSEYIKNSRLSVIIKPNSGKNSIAGWSTQENALIVEIKDPAQDNKANRELIKFISKLAGRRAKIKSGLTSKKKLLVFD